MKIKENETYFFTALEDALIIPITKENEKSNEGKKSDELIYGYTSVDMPKYDILATESLTESWKFFFMQWMQNQEDNHQIVLMELTKQNEEAQSRYDSLYLQYLEVQKQINALIITFQDLQREKEEQLREKEEI